MSKLLQLVKLSKERRRKINMKDIVAGNDDSEKEQEDEDVTEMKTKSNLEATTEQDERKPVDTAVEKDRKTKNQI